MTKFTGDAEARRSEEKKMQKFCLFISSSSLRASAPPVKAFEKCQLNGSNREAEHNMGFVNVIKLICSLRFSVPPVLSIFYIIQI
jgi:hypothetical protein